MKNINYTKHQSNNQISKYVTKENESNQLFNITNTSKILDGRKI